MIQNENQASQAQADAGLWKWIGTGILVALGSFIAFQYILNTTESTPDKPSVFGHFGAEVASAFVGTGLTIAITALLLKSQTQQQTKLLAQQNDHAEKMLDLQFKRDEAKEKGVTVFSTKTDVYKELLGELEKIVDTPVLRESDFSKLTFLSLRVAYVASSGVINQLSNFAEVLLKAVTGPNDPNETDDDEQDKQITRAERRKILLAFSEVSQLIREDLVSEKVNIESIQSIISNFFKAGEIANLPMDRATTTISTQSTDVQSNNGEEPLPINLAPTTIQNITQMTEEQFLAACRQPGEQDFYRVFLDQIRGEKFEPLWTQKGFSINKTLKFYPSFQIGNKNSNLIDYPVNSKRREAVEAALANAGITQKFNEKSSLKFNWSEMQNTTPIKLVEVIKAVLR